MLQFTRALVILCLGITGSSSIATAQGTSPLSMEINHNYAITNTQNIKPSVKLPTMQEIEAVAKAAAIQSARKSNKLFATPMNKITLGTTAYDLQTNGSIYRRIGAYSDGGINYAQAIWITAADTAYANNWTNPPYPDRGSYYGVLDLTDMTKPALLEPAGNAKWKRAESQRAGFGSLVQFGTNGRAGIISHPAGSDGLLFTSNNEFGVAQWTTQTCGSTTANGLWARSAIDGKGYIHVIYSYQTTDSKAGTLGYIRSTNGGKNWSDEVPIHRLANLTVATSSDEYAIAARGNSVVIAYSGNAGTWLRMFKSTDNGANFSGIDGAEGVVFMGPSRITGKLYTTSIGNGQVSYRTDTVVTPGSMMNVMIDKDEKAHLVFSQYMCSLFGKGELVKGSSGRDSIANSQGDTVNPVAFNDNAAYLSLGLAYWKEGDTNSVSIAPPCGGMWDGKGSVISRRTGEGMSGRPILSFDEATGNILCVFSSFINGDFKALNWDSDARTSPSITENDWVTDTTWNDAMLMHSYITVRNPAGKWSTPQLLSAPGKDNRDATVYENTVNGYLYMLWEQDAYPGCWVGNPQIIQPNRVADVIFATVPLSAINSVDDENGVAHEDGLTIATFPNPAGFTGATVQFTSDHSGLATVEAYNSLGVKVATLFNGVVEPGSYNAGLDTKELSNGAYYIVVKVGASMASKTINVVR